MKFSSKLERDGKDLILVLPNGLVKAMAIEEGDDIVPVEFGLGSAVLRLEKPKLEKPAEQS